MKMNKMFEKIIKEFKNDWWILSEEAKLSEDFIRKFKDKVDWEKISRYQKLSCSFICEFWEKVNWEEISTYQQSIVDEADEEFINRFSGMFWWGRIANHLRLSKEFVKIAKKYLYKYMIHEKQKFSEELIQELSDNGHIKSSLYCDECREELSPYFDYVRVEEINGELKVFCEDCEDNCLKCLICKKYQHIKNLKYDYEKGIEVCRKCIKKYYKNEKNKLSNINLNKEEE